MIKFIIVLLGAAVVEVLQMILLRDFYSKGDGDPNAIPYVARKVFAPSFGYTPGETTYDEKYKRYVTGYKYEWEYQGKKHTMRFSDNPNNRYEHYLSTFPDEITITIHKDTGKYYVGKDVRTMRNRYLISIVVSVAVSYFVTSLFI